MTTRRDSPKPDRFVFVGLLLLLFWLPLPWGSNRPGAVAILGLACAVLAGVWALLWLRGRVQAPQLDPLSRLALATWLLWIGWISVQLLPLPGLVIHTLAPQSAVVHSALGERAFKTISIAPGLTVQQLALSVVYLLLFWLTMCTVRHRTRRQWFLGTILIAAFLQAFYGSIMTLSGLEWGFLQAKTHGNGWATGTFVNRNHFASYLHIGLAAGIGLLLGHAADTPARDWRERARRLINTIFSARMSLRVALAVMAIGLVLSQSRMGNVAFFTALSVCGALWLLLRNRRYLGKGLILFLSILVVDVWIVSNWFGLEEVVQRLEQTDLATEQRMIVVADLEPLIGLNSLTGSGLGSFEHAFAPYRQEFLGHFDHAHNEPLQFLVETGVPGLAILAFLIMTLVLHATRVVSRRRDSTAAALAFAAFMAISCLLFHSIVEFNFRIPSIAATAVALLGALAATSSTSQRSRHSTLANAEQPALHSNYSGERKSRIASLPPIGDSHEKHRE